MFSFQSLRIDGGQRERRLLQTLFAELSRNDDFLQS